MRFDAGFKYYGDLNGAGKSHGPVGLKYLTSGSWTLASETRCLYDGLRVIQERDGANVPTVAYTRGSDLSGSLEGAGGIGGLLARSHGYSGGAFSAHSFYHADGNGNVTYLISSAQAGVAEYRYDPYGNLRYTYDSLPSGGNRYRFSSKEQMPNSGLYYYGYRFYDPNLQRWLNRDPIGEEAGNLYTMVGNDSVGDFDALGLAGKAKPPHFDPGFWDPSNRPGNNCCNYAYDQPGPPFNRYPGWAARMPDFDYKNKEVNCDKLKIRIIADFRFDQNVGRPKGGRCATGYHKIKVWASPKTSELEIVIGPTHFAAGIPARNVLARL